MVVLIGISGQAAVGKTTAANVFVNQFNLVEISFADPIKRIAAELWGWNEQTLWGASLERNRPDENYPLPLSEEELEARIENNRAVYLTPRHALQQIGDNVRQIDSEVWLRLGLNIAKKIMAEPDKLSYSRHLGLYAHKGAEVVNGVVFADTRYINEMKKIKEAGGLLIRIKRPNGGLVGDYSYHLSETEQLSVPDSYFDIVVNNDDSLKKFNEDITNIALNLKLTRVLNKQLEFQW